MQLKQSMLILTLSILDLRRVNAGGVAQGER
jgi:hypothetical protein